MTDDKTSAQDASLQESGLSPTAEAVVNKRQYAAELRAWPGRLEKLPQATAHARADQLDAEADMLSDVSTYSATSIVMGTGGELAPDVSKSHSFADTMQAHPSAVAVDASRHRVSLAKGAGVAALALDAAETVQAQNSLEKMLAHQMAAAHGAAMELQAEGCALIREFQKSDRRYAILTTEAARLLNACARMMEASQRSAMTLHKLRHSGKQVVVVQHMTVSKAGQEGAAGQVQGRGRRTRTA